MQPLVSSLFVCFFPRNNRSCGLCFRFFKFATPGCAGRLHKRSSVPSCHGRLLHQQHGKALQFVFALFIFLSVFLSLRFCPGPSFIGFGPEFWRMAHAPARCGPYPKSLMNESIVFEPLVYFSSSFHARPKNPIHPYFFY